MVGLREIDAIADELKRRAPNLPFGIEIKVDDDAKGIIVGNDEWAFAITYQTLDTGMYIDAFDGALPHLLDYLQLPSKSIH